jgi:glycosyltransferase involved in cell wall biosynthesis
MRILFLNDLEDERIGSSVRLVHQLAAHYRALGHHTALATAVQDPALAGRADVRGLAVHRLHSDYNPRWRAWTSLDNPRTRAGFARVLAEERPDVVHAHLVHQHLSYATLGASRRAGAGVVHTAHDVMTFCHQKLTCFHGGEEHGGELRDYEARPAKCLPCQRLRWNPFRNARIRRILEHDVQRTTVVSEELGRALRANGLRVDRVVHNALEPRATLPDPAAVLALRRKFGVEGRRLVAIGGRLHEQKGVKQLLRMLRLLAPRFPDLRLLVMGRSEVYAREFESLARELGVDGLVVPTGWLEGDELQAAIAAVDVFVTPSICFDTFGMVNLEAMEHSKPVVATVFGGSPEVVVDGVTGYVRNPFQVESYAEALAGLLSDPDLRARMGAAGRTRLVERFLLPRMAGEYLEEYATARASAAAS